MTEASTIYIKEHPVKRLHLYGCGHLGIVELDNNIYSNCGRCEPLDVQNMWSKAIFEQFTKSMDKEMLDLLVNKK